MEKNIGEKYVRADITVISLLASGLNVGVSSKTANKVASLGVTRRYAVSSIPTKEEIKSIKTRS